MTDLYFVPSCNVTQHELLISFFKKKKKIRKSTLTRCRRDASRVCVEGTLRGIEQRPPLSNHLEALLQEDKRFSSRTANATRDDKSATQTHFPSPRERERASSTPKKNVVISVESWRWRLIYEAIVRPLNCTSKCRDYFSRCENFPRDLAATFTSFGSGSGQLAAFRVRLTEHV